MFYICIKYIIKRFTQLSVINENENWFKAVTNDNKCQKKLFMQYDI